MISRVGPAAPIDDIVQESFSRGLAKAESLHAEDSLFSWLCGIALRVAKEMARKERRTPRVNVANDPEPIGSPLLEAAENLPAEYAVVIRLRFVEELDCRQIATRLDVPLGTVTKRLSRAYAMLREKSLSGGTGRTGAGRGMDHQGARS